MSLSYFIAYIQSGQTKECLSIMQSEYVNMIYNAETRWRPIHYACGYGRLEIAKALIKHKCDPNVVTMDKCHSLHLAARRGHTKVVQLLIAYNCDIERKNLNFERPIHLACRFGWIDVVQLLINNGCSINSVASEKWTPLHYATRYCHTHIMTLLLDNGANISAKVEDGSTARDIASDWNYNVAVQLLDNWKAKNVASKSNIPQQVYYVPGYTPTNTISTINNHILPFITVIEEEDLDKFKELYKPACLRYKGTKTGLGILDLLLNKGAKEMLKIVLDQGIEDDILQSLDRYELYGDKVIDQYRLYRAITTKDEQLWRQSITISIINEPFLLTNESFLEVAAQYGGTVFTKMVYELLLDRDETWTKAKEAATSLNLQDVVKVIEDREKYLEVRELVRWNRLHIAVYDDRTDMVQYILSNYLVDPTLVDSSLNTPLHLALTLGHRECAMMLLPKELDINRKNKFGQTILHMAVDANMEELVDAILTGRPDMTKLDLLRLNPLMASIANGNRDICTKLLAKEKYTLTENLKFDSSVLEILWRLQRKGTIKLTTKENYFTFCLKMNGELFDSLKGRINYSALSFKDANENTLLHMSSQLFLFDLSTFIVNIGRKSIVVLRNKGGNTAFHSFLTQCINMDGNNDRSKIEDFLTLFIDSGSDLSSRNIVGESLKDVCIRLNNERIYQRIFCDNDTVAFSSIELVDILNRNWFSTFDKSISRLKDSHLASVLTEPIIIQVMENCLASTIDTVLPSMTEASLDNIREELLVVAAKRDLLETFEVLWRQYKLTNGTLRDGETLLTSLFGAERYEYCKMVMSVESARMKSCGLQSLVDQKNSNGQTAFHVAASCGNMELLEHMLLESAQWDHADNNGDTVLGILLTKYGDSVETSKTKDIEKLIKILVRGGEDLFRKGKDNKPIIYNCSSTDLRLKLQIFQKTVQPTSRTADTDKNVCQICLDKEVNCVLQCGHPFCNECLSKLSLCPVCRDPIERHQHLYI